MGYELANLHLPARRWLIAALAPALTVAVALAPSAALADNGRHGAKGHGNHRQRADCGHHSAYEQRGRGYAPSYRQHPDRFVIPRVLHARAWDDYEPYYHGRSYYRPHRHEHVIYSFPVYAEHGYVMRPHAYCNGELFENRVSYDGPRLSIRVGF